jgi:hypothetical protein
MASSTQDWPSAVPTGVGKWRWSGAT